MRLSRSRGLRSTARPPTAHDPPTVPDESSSTAPARARTPRGGPAHGAPAARRQGWCLYRADARWRWVWHSWLSHGTRCGAYSRAWAPAPHIDAMLWPHPRGPHQTRATRSRHSWPSSSARPPEPSCRRVSHRQARNRRLSRLKYLSCAGRVYGHSSTSPYSPCRGIFRWSWLWPETLL